MKITSLWLTVSARVNSLILIFWGGNWGQSTCLRLGNRRVAGARIWTQVTPASSQLTYLPTVAASHWAQPGTSACCAFSAVQMFPITWGHLISSVIYGTQEMEAEWRRWVIPCQQTNCNGVFITILCICKKTVSGKSKAAEPPRRNIPSSGSCARVCVCVCTLNRVGISKKAYCVCALVSHSLTDTHALWE